MRKQLGIMALVVGAVVGCGVPVGRSGPRAVGSGEPVVWVDGGCAAQDVDPQPMVGSAAAGGGVPSGFDAVAVVRCRNEVRQVAGEGTWTVRVTERAEAPLAELVAALRRPSDPPPAEQIACPAVRHSLPYFVVVGADGRALLPDVPTGVCGEPRGEVVGLLDALPFRTVAQTPVALHRDPWHSSGCYDLRKDTTALAAPRPGPAGAVWPGVRYVLVCVYMVHGADGWLEKGYQVSGHEAAALAAVLGAAGPAAPCAEPHTRFAVLSAGSGTGAVVELDGCLRVRRPDGTFGQLDETAVAGLVR